MNTKATKDFLKERLTTEYVTSEIVSVELSGTEGDEPSASCTTVCVCHVKDIALALTSLNNYATAEMPMLFVSARRTPLQVIGDYIEEHIGVSLSNFDINRKSAYSAVSSLIDGLGRSHAYMYHGTLDLHDSEILKLIREKNIVFVIVEHA